MSVVLFSVGYTLLVGGLLAAILGQRPRAAVGMFWVGLALALAGAITGAVG